MNPSFRWFWNLRKSFVDFAFELKYSLIVGEFECSNLFQYFERSDNNLKIADWILDIPDCCKKLQNLMAYSDPKIICK